jgi:hypothetical protein
MQQWLLGDLRLDPDELARQNLADIRACLGTGFKRRQLGTLLAAMECLQGVNRPCIRVVEQMLERVRQGSLVENSPVEDTQAVQEVMQEIALAGLYRRGFSGKAAS